MENKIAPFVAQFVQNESSTTLSKQVQSTTKYVNLMKTALFPSIKTFILASFCLIVGLSFGQSKEDAINSLKETFAKYFIKTAIYKNNSENKDPHYYDYEITDKNILFRETSGEGENLKITWTRVPYKDIEGIAPMKKSDYFKKVTALQFQPSYGNVFRTSHGQEFEDFQSYTKYINIPFNNSEDNTIIESMGAAITVIKKENLAEEKIAKVRGPIDAAMAYENTLPGTSLQQFDMFTKDSSKVNLHDYIEKSRKFKEKPTLIIIYSNEYCPPCLIKIDSLLNNNQTLQYNIALINMDFSSDFTKLKKKITDHSPDYTKNVLLVFDRTDAMKTVHKNSAPMFLWLDKKMKIVGSQRGYKITTSTINAVLLEIESKP